MTSTDCVRVGGGMIVAVAMVACSGDDPGPSAGTSEATGSVTTSTTEGVDSSGSSPGASTGSGTDADPETGADSTSSGGEVSCGPELLVPAVRWFAAPTVDWQPVEGATTYTVEIAATEAELDTDPIVAEDRTTPWTGELEAGEYAVRVTAQPSGEACVGAFAVRTLDAVPDVVSPQTLCGDAEGVGSRIAYAVAALDGSVYSSFNADGAGLCRYDARTLEHLETLPAFGGSFRTFGVAANVAEDTVYVTSYPFLGSCGDRLDRVLAYVDPDGDGTFTTLDTGIESPTSIGVGPRGALHVTGLFGGSCWQEDTFCLDLGDPCTNGNGAWAAWDPRARAEIDHGGMPWAGPGVAADDTHVYRAGLMDGLEIFDARGGGWLRQIAMPATPRGLIRVDVGGDRLLVVTLFDQTLRVYRLPERGAPRDFTDVVEVHQLALDDRYWQGAYDPETEALYFPAQNSRTIRRHDLR